MAEFLDIVGLGNALVDALYVMPGDELLDQESLDKGVMHAVSDKRWQSVYDSLPAGKVELQSGGSCANTIATLGLLGAKVSFCAQVGDDDFGKLYQEQMLS